MTTSKRILVISYVSTFTLTLLVIIGTFLQIDMSNITTLASLSWGEVATANIWYYKKAAKENVPKIIASLPKDFKAQLDVNQLLNQ